VPANLANRLTVVSAEVSDRLEVWHQSTSEPD
jgi:hypothetical protein